MNETQKVTVWRAVTTFVREEIEIDKLIHRKKIEAASGLSPSGVTRKFESGKFTTYYIADPLLFPEQDIYTLREEVEQTANGPKSRRGSADRQVTQTKG
jgi:hypothetical protein